MRLQKLLLVGSVTALVAGCGGSSAGSVGGGGADPAQAVPAGVPVYVEGAVRPEGDQGDAARALLAKFLPAGTTIPGLIDKSIKDAGEKATYEADIKPWLGRRVGIGVTDFTGSQPSYFGAVAITDAGRAEAFLGKEGTAKGQYAGAKLFQDKDTWAGVKGDYLVIADTEANVRKALDAENGQSLGDAPAFRSALSGLPAAGDRLGAFYLDLKAFGDLAAQAPGMDPAGRAVLAKVFGPGSRPIAAALTATDSSATIESRATGLGALGMLGSGTSTQLIEDAPADAFAVYGAADVGGTIKKSIETFAGALGGAALSGQLEQQTGINLDRDVLSWAGDLAVYVRGDSLSSLNGAVIIGAKDEPAARAALPRLVAAAKRSGAPVKATRVAGADLAFSVPAPGAPGPVVLAEGNGRVVLALGQDAAAAAIKPSGDTFGDSATFSQAKSAVDGIEPTIVLSLPSVLKLAEGAGAASGAGYQKARPYLDKLGLVVAGSQRNGDSIRSLFTVTTR